MSHDEWFVPTTAPLGDIELDRRQLETISEPLYCVSITGIMFLPFLNSVVEVYPSGNVGVRNAGLPDAFTSEYITGDGNISRNKDRYNDCNNSSYRRKTSNSSRNDGNKGRQKRQQQNNNIQKFRIQMMQCQSQRRAQEQRLLMNQEYNREADADPRRRAKQWAYEQKQVYIRQQQQEEAQRLQELQPALPDEGPIRVIHDAFIPRRRSASAISSPSDPHKVGISSSSSSNKSSVDKRGVRTTRSSSTSSLEMGKASINITALGDNNFIQQQRLQDCSGQEQQHEADKEQQQQQPQPQQELDEDQMFYSYLVRSIDLHPLAILRKSFY